MIFRYIFKILDEHNAFMPVSDSDLTGTLRKLISNSGLRKEVGQRAFEVINANRGAVDKTIDILESGKICSD